MAIVRIRRIIAVALFAILVAVLPTIASAQPVSVFVVHCEPTKANPIMWLELVDLVSLADAYAVSLSIDFTPQWAAMILDDTAKLEIVQSWIDAGHEIGCHHHGYWGTREHGSTWDGYTNTPVSELDPADRAQYLGTMADFMALLNALPGERRSGCLGCSHAGDVIDYVCQLEYSTQGHALEDALAFPEPIDRNGCQIVEIGHALIASQERRALQDLYTNTDDVCVFGVNGHVYNYADFSPQFEAWFAYLASLDAAGTRRGTVSEVLDEWVGAP
ncbi:hypothetical protein IH601_08100 [Candidatus Bipolaricaulota bacterium]|nr:hypothetical protein [Candidatus Bipolaricaulota bacterium]